MLRGFQNVKTESGVEYKIQIFDTVVDSWVTSERFSELGSLLLVKNGSDDKIQDIVSTELQFTIVDNSNNDAVYADLFTANEYRFKVTLTNLDTNQIDFVGFLLPETYSEPYQYKHITLNFTAVCGLGLLKGKFFDPAFYNDEHSVVNIITTALAFTGLNLNLRFAAALEPSSEDNFENVFLDMRHYYDVEKDKYTSVYDVLVEIIVSLGCVCFQEQGQWFIEGYNKRTLSTYIGYNFNSDGTLQEKTKFARSRVVAVPLANPTVTIDPTIKSATAEKKVKLVEINNGVSKIKERGIVGEIAANKTVFPAAWLQNNGINASANIADLVVRLPIRFHVDLSTIATDYISLFERINIRQGMRIRFKLKIKIESDTTDTGLLEAYVEDGTFTDPLKYDLRLNSTSIVSNYSGSNQIDQGVLSFDKNKNAEIDYTFIAAEAGVLDLRIYQPYSTTFIPFKSFEFTKITVAEIGEGLEDDSFTVLVNDNYSTLIEIEVPIADHINSGAKSFQLQKYRSFGTDFETVTITTLYSFEANSKFYAVLNLFDLTLLERHRNNVSIAINDIIFNYNNAEQMVIETASLLPDATVLTVRVYRYAFSLPNLLNSETYTDALTNIERDRFLEAYAKVISRLYSKESFVVDGEFLGKISFNDLINFPFANISNFYVSNCTYNLTENTTSVMLHQCLYDASVDTPTAFPPFVYAGEDVYINNTETTSSLLATAYDQDGWINSQIWEQVAPASPLATFSAITALGTNLSNLTESLYEFKITVTDNDGLTASDNVRVIRNLDYTIVLTQTLTESEDENVTREKRSFDMTVTPALPSGTSLNLSLDVILETIATGNSADADASMLIRKNNSDIFNNDNIQNDPYLNETFTMNYSESDSVSFTLEAQGFFDYGTNDNFYALSQFIIQSATVINGSGTVVNLPIGQSVSVT